MRIAPKVFVLAGALLVSQSMVLSGQGVNRGVRVRSVADTLFGGVGGVAVDRLGIIYVADFGEKVFKVTPDGSVSVFATGLYGTSGNAIDSRGNLLQSSFSGNYISKIDRLGNGVVFAEGFNGPVGIAVDAEDNLTVCNCSNNTLSRVTSDGMVSEFAASSLLNCPNGITLASDGNYYVVNFSDTRMLKVTPEGVVSEFATLPGGGNGHVTFTRGESVRHEFPRTSIISSGIGWLSRTVCRHWCDWRGKWGGRCGDIYVSKRHCSWPAR